MLTPERKKEYYQAIVDKNIAYEGLFYVGDQRTRVFCRPSCPTKKPKIELCDFFESPSRARLSGYHPCPRCRPDMDAPERNPTGKRKRSSSYLVDETSSMERKRRLVEQKGHRQFTRVNAREHPEEEVKAAPEGELQNSILQHPELDNQRFDGIDPNLNPEPPLNTEARREFDNERREQEMEKQLRLGNMPKFSSAPKPQGP